MAEETTVVATPPAGQPGDSKEVVAGSTTPAGFDLAAMKKFGETFSGRKKPALADKVAADKPKEAGTEKPDETNGKPPAGSADAKPDETAGNDKPAKPKRSPRQPATPPALNETRLAEIAAEAGARASSETITRLENERAKPEQQRDESFAPPKEYAEQYVAFQAMAKANPGKYGDLVDDFKRFVGEEEAYIKTWKREHPGEAWDGDSDEHDAFYDKATPAYDDKDFRKAELASELADAKKELRKEVLDEVQPKLNKLDELEREQTLRSLQPAVDAAERTALGTILKAVDPQYERFVEPTEFAKLKESDPVAFDIALQIGSDALPFVAEVTRLWKSNGVVRARDDNPLHRYIYSYAAKMTDLIKELPENDQLRDGKRFASWSEFASMKPAEQARHWTLSDGDLIARKLLDAQEIAAQRVADEDKKLANWAKRKGLSAGNANNGKPKHGDADREKESKALAGNGNSGSPTVGSRTQVSPNAAPAPDARPTWLGPFEAILSGRKV